MTTAKRSGRRHFMHIYMRLIRICIYDFNRNVVVPFMPAPP